MKLENRLPAFLRASLRLSYPHLLAERGKCLFDPGLRVAVTPFGR
jgi:hypothetical protein